MAWPLFLLAPALTFGVPSPLPAPQPRWRGFHTAELRLAPLPAGEPLARIALARLLDRNRTLVGLRLGGLGGAWHAGLGFDASYRERFVLLSRGKRLFARRLAQGDSLLRGVALEPVAGKRYLLRFHLRLPRPASDSVLSLEPMRAAPGVPVRLRLDDLTRRALGAGSALAIGPKTFVVFYLTDIGPPGLAPTRTVLIAEPRGLRSRLWPIPEASLPAGQAVAARLGRLRLVLLRSADGTLAVYRA